MERHGTLTRHHQPGYIKYSSEQTTDYSTHSSNRSNSVHQGSDYPTLQRVTPPYMHNHGMQNGHNLHGNMQQYRVPSPAGSSYYRQTTYGPPSSNGHHLQHNHPAPVTQQPRPSADTESVNEEPRQWNTDMCQCIDGTCTCCAICCCLPCFECWLADQLGEGCCLPICVPLATMAMRQKMRLNNNIQGSILGDFCATLFCRPCILCQMKRELDHIESQNNEQSEPQQTAMQTTQIHTLQPGRHPMDNIV